VRQLTALWANDLRNTLRDHTVGVLLVIPLVFALALRLGLASAEAGFPLLADHRGLVIALFCLLASAFPGLMLAFILLEERDEGLFPVFRTLPISPRRFLLARLALATLLSFLYPLIILVTVQAIAPLPGWRIPLLALLCSLQAPLSVLVVLVLAGNKIEGLAVIKVLFPAILLPAAPFAVAVPWAHLLSVLPAYWTYRAFVVITPEAVALATVGALLFHLVPAALLLRRFRRRVFL